MATEIQGEHLRIPPGGGSRYVNLQRRWYVSGLPKRSWMWRGRQSWKRNPGWTSGNSALEVSRWNFGIFGSLPVVDRKFKDVPDDFPSYKDSVIGDDRGLSGNLVEIRQKLGEIWWNSGLQNLGTYHGPSAISHFPHNFMGTQATTKRRIRQLRDWTSHVDLYGMTRLHFGTPATATRPWLPLLILQPTAETISSGLLE